MPEESELKYITGQKTSARVLIVDDQKATVKLIMRYLLEAEYVSIPALTGTSALEMLRLDDKFDLIILDLTLPDVSGLEVCRKIRENFSLFEMPILILTSSSDIDIKIDAFDSGANDYIQKPFEHKEFMARVRNLIKLKKLTEANSVLQSAIEMKNRFHRMTIHDLKNPLASILVVANVMKMDENLSEADEESLNLIIDSSELMQSLIEDFLKESQIESGKMVLNKQGVDLNIITRKVVEVNRFRAEKKKQVMLFKPGPDGHCAVNVDPVRMHEVIDNIISNAIKYTPFEKHINTSVSVSINSVGKKVVRVAVQDEGPGFTEEDRRNMFNKFTKLSAVPTGGESSSGLGLSIAKQLVDMHNGRIWAETKIGVGTTFFIELPAF